MAQEELDSVEAPPLYGNDLDEIVTFDDDCTKDDYVGLMADRKKARTEREEAENQKSDKVKLNFVQPRKEKRFKIYFKYEGMQYDQWV